MKEETTIKLLNACKMVRDAGEWATKHNTKARLLESFDWTVLEAAIAEAEEREPQPLVW
jgi:hypothetical protein